MTIQELREKLANKLNEAKHLMAEKGDQKWTDEDKAKYDGIMDEAEEVQESIKREQRRLDAEAQAHFNDINPKDPTAPVDEKAKGFELFLRRGFNRLTQDELDSIRNAMSTTTNTEGGYTVAESIAKTVIESISHYGTMRQISDHVTTASGEPMSWPTSAANEEGEIVKENVAAGSSDITFGTRAVPVYKFSSKIITVPFELLQDSSVDIIDLVTRRCGTRIGRAQDHFFTTGSGTDQPMGVMSAATVGVTTATGKTTEITYDNLCALIESVDQSYLAGGNRPTFMMSQATRLLVRTMKDSNGRPIWTPNDAEGISAGIPGLLLGYNVHVNNFMDAPAAGKVPLAFGLFNPSYLIRDTMNVQIFRFDDSAYISKGQIGFMAWARSGGNLLVTDAVKTLKMAAA